MIFVPMIVITYPFCHMRFLFADLPDEVQGDSEQKNPTGAISESGSSSGSYLNPKLIGLAGSATASILSCNTSIGITAMQDVDCPVDLNDVHNSFTYEQGACEKTKGSEDMESVAFADTDYGAIASTFLKG